MKFLCAVRLILLALPVSSALAQPWAVPTSVPSSECEGYCSLPVSQCATSWGYTSPWGGATQDCLRTDSVPLGYPKPGYLIKKVGNPVHCPYCPECCDPPAPNPPCMCEGPPYIVCGLSTVTVQEVIIPKMSPRLSAGEAAMLGIALRQQVGYTAATCTRSCPGQSPLCADLTTFARLWPEADRTGRFDHQWHRVVTYNCPGPPPFTTWQAITCGTGSSTATALIISCPPSAECEVLGTWCGIICP